LIDNVSFDLAFNDAAKKTVAHGTHLPYQWIYAESLSSGQKATISSPLISRGIARRKAP
jgi:hypothetical protein